MEEANPTNLLNEVILHSEEHKRGLKPVTKYDALSTIQIYAYGVGHFANDIIAGLMMNYGVYFLVTAVPVNPDPEITGNIVG